MIDVKEIMQILPHRYPFLLVDRIESLKEGEEIVGIKNVSINEPFFVGHFPGNPIMPGVLIIEAMAQVGGVLAFHSSPKEWAGSLVYFMGIDKVRFRKPVVPGDQLRLKLTTIRQKQKVFKMRGEAYVDDTLVAEAELMAVIESKGAERSTDDS
ncbi:MAG: 3-hydroxyacyl-ACP dehydratase FabZ [Proteobacteria bacterium]|jgi:beta-hydroxyacyl-ACP dehydratase FabZ|nr:3-hydroxyacyl-ACP dehydratase FabZ [Pseudomonadota bacterium]MBW2579460.1 3-hydroxyacyl-ACP dehydratase FabZ [Deltaproteobacteria bacterium]MCK5657098.1 3-hydroxyacyl-ACP dehydratase FabZ [Deltaproteobacteria bacterium]